MLFAALRVSSQTESRRPFGATENVPNQCHLLGLTGSSLTRFGALKVCSAVGAAHEHHVGAAAGAGRLDAGQHVNIVISAGAGTVDRQEDLPSQAIRIDQLGKNDVAAQVDWSALVETWCDGSVPGIARANAPKLAVAEIRPADIEDAVAIHVERSPIGRVRDENRVSSR